MKEKEKMLKLILKRKQWHFLKSWKNKSEKEKGEMMKENNYFLDNDYGKNNNDIYNCKYTEIKK